MSEIATRKSTRENPAVARDGAGSVSTRAPSSIEVYREDFESQPAGPDWLQTLRKQGMTRFQALGFPTTKNEDWHFTSVAPIAERTFRLASRGSATAASGVADRRESSRRRDDGASSLGVTRADLDKFNFGENGWHTIVFVNGAFSEDLSSKAGLGNGVRVSSLAGAIKSGTVSIERHLGKIAAFDNHAFTALNTAFIHDGAFIELQANAVVDLPIHLLFVTAQENALAVSSPRVLVLAGAVFFTVSFVGFLVVAHQVRQCEAIVGRDKIDAGIRSAPAAFVQIAAPRRAIRHGGGNGRSPEWP